MARKALIATHGHLADGFKSAVELLMGSENQIDTVNAYTEEEPDDYMPRIVDFVNGIGDSDEGVIFTDLAGGSVNQRVVKTLSEFPGGIPDNVFLITESNLMAILAIMLEARPISASVIEETTSQTHPTLIQLKVAVDTESDDEEAFLD